MRVRGMDGASEEAGTESPDWSTGLVWWDGQKAERTLPNLTVDWSDPLMHTVRATRLSVPQSVMTAFKAAADRPGRPPQTALVMEAVSLHLARLPELVVARRPPAVTDSSTFFRRPTTPKTNAVTVALYIRPNMGEDTALNRIVDWVSEIVSSGHPTRKAATRSEVVTAALAAQYADSN